MSHREIAAMAMQGILSAGSVGWKGHLTIDPAQVASLAVQMANALEKKLAEEYAAKQGEGEQPQAFGGRTAPFVVSPDFGPK